MILIWKAIWQVTAKSSVSSDRVTHCVILKHSWREKETEIE